MTLSSISVSRGDLRHVKAVVLEPDRRVEHEALHAFRIYAGEAHRQHAAHRMADDRNLVDLELIEQRRGVAGELVEMEIESWLRGFIEADLVRRDDAIARAG